MKIQLATYHENMHDDSYFGVIYYDTERESFSSVETGSTAYAGRNDVPQFTPFNESEHKEMILSAIEKFVNEKFLSYIENKTFLPKMGEMAKIVKGKNSGTIGFFFWQKEYQHYTKVGISPSGERVNGKFPDAIWDYLKNIEVVDIEKEIKDEKKYMLPHWIELYQHYKDGKFTRIEQLIKPGGRYGKMANELRFRY